MSTKPTNIVAPGLECRTSELLAMANAGLKLEATIVSLARSEMLAVLAFYKKRSVGKVCQNDLSDFDNNFTAMNTLFSLAHLADTGMSSEGERLLLSLEAEHSAHLKAHLAEHPKGTNDFIKSGSLSEVMELARTTPKIDEIDQIKDFLVIAKQ